jgi:hypothetical protein
MVLNGRSILMTLIADTLLEVMPWLIHPMITTRKSIYKCKHLSTYNVPCISHVRVRLKHETQGDYFQNHFNCEDCLEYQVSYALIWKVRQIRIVHCQKYAVCENGCEDKPIEPRVKHNPDYSVSERVGDCQTE